MEMSDVGLRDKEVVPGSSQPFYDFYKWHVFDDGPQEALENLFKLVICLKWDVSSICANI